VIRRFEQESVEAVVGASFVMITSWTWLSRSPADVIRMNLASLRKVGMSVAPQ